MATKNAPIGEEFAGPVMMEGLGRAQFLSETLVPIMQARRPPDAENPRMMQVTPNPFLNRTGLRVMADAFGASDTPSLKQFEGRTVAGSYAVDDEGVRAKDVTLVDAGRSSNAIDQPHAAEKIFCSPNGHGRRHGVGRRVSAREHAGNSGLGAESEVSRAAASPGQDVRLHRPRRAIGGTRRSRLGTRD